MDTKHQLILITDRSGVGVGVANAERFLEFCKPGYTPMGFSQYAKDEDKKFTSFRCSSYLVSWYATCRFIFSKHGGWCQIMPTLFSDLCERHIKELGIDTDSLCTNALQEGTIKFLHEEKAEQALKPWNGGMD